MGGTNTAINTFQVSAADGVRGMSWRPCPESIWHMSTLPSRTHCARCCSAARAWSWVSLGVPHFVQAEVNEVQLLECSCVGACSGTFKLSVFGYTTPAISVTASSADLVLAIRVRAVGRDVDHGCMSVLRVVEGGWSVFKFGKGWGWGC